VTTPKTKKSAKKTTNGKPKKAKASANGKADPLAGVVKEKLALVERMEQLGLLDARDVEQLIEQTSAISGGNLTDGLNAAAGWMRTLSGGLDGFGKSDGDSKPGPVHQALVSWQPARGWARPWSVCARS